MKSCLRRERERDVERGYIVNFVHTVNPNHLTTTHWVHLYQSNVTYWYVESNLSHKWGLQKSHTPLLLASFCLHPIVLNQGDLTILRNLLSNPTIAN